MSFRLSWALMRGRFTGVYIAKAELKVRTDYPSGPIIRQKAVLKPKLSIQPLHLNDISSWKC